MPQLLDDHLSPNDPPITLSKFLWDSFIALCSSLFTLVVFVGLLGIIGYVFVSNLLSRELNIILGTLFAVIGSLFSILMPLYDLLKRYYNTFLKKSALRTSLWGIFLGGTLSLLLSVRLLLGIELAFYFWIWLLIPIIWTSLRFEYLNESQWFQGFAAYWLISTIIVVSILL